MQGRKTLQPKMMYQVSLDTLVAKDNFYRQVNSNLDLSFLYKETSIYYGSEGQESIDPVVFFKILLVGYLNNINSDRKLIEFCSNRLDIRLLLQYDIDEPLPWHSTISRTRQLYGEEVFLSLFRKVLSLCVAKGMVRGKRQAVDSVFVKANASLDSFVEKEVMADIATYADEFNQGSEYQVPLKKVEGPRNEDEGTKSNKVSNKTHYSTTDPDARISTKPGKPYQLNYYGQIAVDDAHHVITAANADFADKSDSQCFEKVVNQVIENFDENNLSIDQLVTDTGYSSGEVLRYVEKENIDAYIPNLGSYKSHRDGFIYNKEQDQYECIKGNKAILHFKKIITDNAGLHKKTYRSSRQECKDCPLRSACVGGKGNYKQITETIDKPHYDLMGKKMKTSYAKRMLRIRAKTVEPVLGTLINFVGMKKVNSRGIKQANKHVMMASLSYNLKKYLRFISKQIKCRIVALAKEGESMENPFYEVIATYLKVFVFGHKMKELITNHS